VRVPCFHDELNALTCGAHYSVSFHLAMERECSLSFKFKRRKF